MAKGPSLDQKIRAAWDHLKLLSDDFSKDINLRDNIFDAYSFKDFIPYLRLGKPVIKSDIRATWYADEKDGTEWQGKVTATGTQFNTYAYDVALNPKLHSKFPQGSYVKVSNQVEGEAKPREIMVRITDSKGGEGVDLSKAAAHFLGIRGTSKVTLQLMQPKDCNIASMKKDQPMKGCDSHPDEVKLYIGSKSEEFTGVRGKYDRYDFPLYNLQSWRRSHRIQLLGLNKGIVRSEVFAQHRPGTDFQMRWVYAVGPFEKVADAYEYATAYCGYCTEFSCSPEERALVMEDCAKMTIYQRDWPRKARGAKYHRRRSEVKIDPGKKEPKPVVADADHEFEEDDEFAFSKVTINLKSRNILERYRSKLIRKHLEGLGKVELVSNGEDQEIYQITKFKKSNEDIYFAIADDLTEKYNFFDFHFES